jgi:hypothetical protein
VAGEQLNRVALAQQLDLLPDVTVFSSGNAIEAVRQKYAHYDPAFGRRG